MKTRIKLLHLVAGVFLSCCSIHCYAEALVLTSPPRESAEAGAKLYGPLAKYLTKLIGTEVVYRHPGNWVRYQRDMRRNEYDIIFDGPHFASWRIKYFNHTPVARLPGMLRFYLVARANDDRITVPRDLAARKVCAIPPPNLTSLVLLSRLDGPAREPVIEGIKGGMKGLFPQLIAGDCDGAMFRKSYFDKKLDDAQRAQLKIIYTSDELPNQVITVSDRLSPAQVEKITESLTHGEGADATRDIVIRFAGKKTKSFINVKPGEYQDYSDLLEGVILGWKRQL